MDTCLKFSFASMNYQFLPSISFKEIKAQIEGTGGGGGGKTLPKLIRKTVDAFFSSQTTKHGIDCFLEKMFRFILATNDNNSLTKTIYYGFLIFVPCTEGHGMFAPDDI